jgi:hypothetical protein
VHSLVLEVKVRADIEFKIVQMKDVATCVLSLALSIDVRYKYSYIALMDISTVIDQRKVAVNGLRKDRYTQFVSTLCYSINIICNRNAFELRFSPVSKRCCCVYISTKIPNLHYNYATKHYPSLKWHATLLKV